MYLTWTDLAQPLVAGLASVLGIYLTEIILSALRRRGMCPERWNRDRTFHRPRWHSAERTIDRHRH